MAPSHPDEWAVFELPPSEGDEPAEPGVGGEDTTFPLAILRHNVRWFCRLRWMVLAAFLAVEAAMLLPALPQALGLRQQRLWPAAVAAFLACANVLYLAHIRVGGESRRSVRANLWTQIAVDLLVVTAVVHWVGSVQTFAPFAYLFHVVLACEFLSRKGSLAVALLACALYLGCIGAEVAGLLDSAGVFAADEVRRAMAAAGTPVAVNAGMTVGSLLVVWYLAAKLCEMVRERDRRLAEANRRLEKAQEDRARHMLFTTHELKAPFAAIHANTQLLLRGYCGELSEEVQEILEKISARARRLAVEIQEMLQLANLRSAEDGAMEWERADLAEALRAAWARVEPLAIERGVRLEADLAPAPGRTVAEFAQILFGNLLSNAVAYSDRGGAVRVSCRQDGAKARVSIADEGIGIPPEKLPKVFDEYYRTEEAVRHNKESSGLGLAIVAQAARKLGVRVAVSSRPGAGTRFDLLFPGQ